MILVHFSQLVSDLDHVVEADINPLLVDENGVIALDARQSSRTRAAARRGSPYGPIRRSWSARNRLRVLTMRRCGLSAPKMRPLSNLLRELARRHSMRFFTPLRSLGRQQLVRLTQIDYDREMAFVLTAGSGASPAELIGVVHLIGDPDSERAEFAILVRSDLHRRGIGRLLMTRLIEYARARGLSEIFGYVLRENAPMLGLCAALGLSVPASPDEFDTVKVNLHL